MKTKEELDAIKEEVETLNIKLAELSDEEMAYISGGRNKNEEDIFYGEPSDNPDLSLLGDGDAVWPKWYDSNSKIN